jgi:hypothetical protein
MHHDIVSGAKIKPYDDHDDDKQTFSFPRYKEYRDQQAKLHASWREREDARQAAIARGDPNPPPAEPDPTAEREIGLLGLFKFFFWVAVGILLAGKFVTGEWMWGGGGKAWVSVRKWLPEQQRLFSERLLAQFDGVDPEKPIYLAVRGSSSGSPYSSPLPPPLSCCLSMWGYVGVQGL